MFSAGIAYFSHVLNLSLGPVFWWLLLAISTVVSLGAGASGLIIGGVTGAVDEGKKVQWFGIVLSLAGIVVSAIAIYRAIHALTNW